MTDHAAASLPLRIAILDDEATIRTTLSLCLETVGHHVAAFGTSREALEACEKQVFDLLFLDLRLGTENGLDFMPRFVKQSPWMKIIVITAYASIDTAVEAMRRGALDYLPKPFTPEHVEMLAAKIGERVATEFRLRELMESMDASVPPLLLTSENRAMRGALELARSFAASKSAVLIEGKEGTGKRTLARLMHEWSPRKNAPYMMCSAFSQEEGGAEMELFGGVGKQGARRSRLEYCEGGTLYVDDLSALPDRLQLKLLDFVQSGTFEREETFERVKADVRLIAGSSVPLLKLAESRLFRRDLFYAFSAKTVELPALAERAEDFPHLTEHFLAFYGAANGTFFGGVAPGAMEYLQGYAWPGNLRELRNVIERAVLLAQGRERGGLLRIEDLPPNLRVKDSPVQVGDLVSLCALEELHIRGVLATAQSLESAAKILGIDYATLWRRRKKYGL